MVASRQVRCWSGRRAGAEGRAGMTKRVGLVPQEAGQRKERTAAPRESASSCEHKVREKTLAQQVEPGTEAAASSRLPPSGRMEAARTRGGHGPRVALRLTHLRGLRSVVPSSLG